MSDLLRYLRQQRHLYGDELPLPAAGISPAGFLRGAADMTDERMRPDPLRFGEAATLDDFHDMIRDCMKCTLGKTRLNFVFGVGNPDSDIVLVGEAPGADEDKQGEPFVGRAGRLLNDMLKAIDLAREDVYICNILKCRPPRNRDPLASEVARCEPYLHRQLELIKPLLMLALGRVAAQTLLKTSESLAAMRSKTHAYRGVPLMVTYHPAALLRNPDWKRPAWEDLKRFRGMYEQLGGGGTE